MPSNEEYLGGTTNKVTRYGDSVHRLNMGGSVLHSYLKYLENSGMNGVPRFLGLDENGLEMLTYLPGKTQEKDDLLYHPCLRSDETLVDVARFMRKLHDISKGFLPTGLELGWENCGYLEDQPETICHNDAATWNFAFVNDRIVGLFDFDSACPGTRIWDLTSTVFSFVPITPYLYDYEKKSEVPYERTHHADECKRRLELFFDAYGITCPPSLPDLLYLRIQDFCRQSSGSSLEWYKKVSNHIKETWSEWMI